MPENADSTPNGAESEAPGRHREPVSYPHYLKVLERAPSRPESARATLLKT